MSLDLTDSRVNETRMRAIMRGDRSSFFQPDELSTTGDEMRMFYVMQDINRKLKQLAQPTKTDMSLRAMDFYARVNRRLLKQAVAVLDDPSIPYQISRERLLNLKKARESVMSGLSQDDSDDDDDEDQKSSVSDQFPTLNERLQQALLPVTTQFNAPSNQTSFNSVAPSIDNYSDLFSSGMGLHSTFAHNPSLGGMGLHSTFAHSGMGLHSSPSFGSLTFPEKPFPPKQSEFLSTLAHSPSAFGTL